MFDLARDCLHQVSVNLVNTTGTIYTPIFIGGGAEGRSFSQVEGDMNKLEALFQRNPVVLADGAMGTMLFEAGLSSGDSPQEWNLSHPERVRAVHRAYIDAGSQIILSNTFGSNRFRLMRHNLQSQVEDLNRAGAALLRAEVDDAGGVCLVAGDIGPSGELLTPLGKLTYEAAIEAFAEQASALISGGVDLIWIETMSDLNETLAAVEAVRKMSAEIPVMVTMTFEKHGRTMMGVSPVQAVKALTEKGVSAVGGNCGTGPEELLGVIRAMHDFAPRLPLVFKPNAGVPELVNGQTRYNADPEFMAQAAIKAVPAGARIIGACCGSNPLHIKAMGRELARGSTTTSC